jgi:hypothetical protein
MTWSSRRSAVRPLMRQWVALNDFELTWIGLMGVIVLGLVRYG